MSEELKIRRARPADLGTVLAILEDAAQRAASKGLAMWPLEFPRQPLAEAIEQGEVYLALLDGQAVGTLTLQWSDRPIWGDRPEDAGYVHKLAIHHTYAGRELGRRLLAWAERTIAAAGRDYARLDCMASNPVLRDYYERAGYEYRGETQATGWRASLYEKRV
jgi:protein-tyrosine phosphatase